MAELHSQVLIETLGARVLDLRCRSAAHPDGPEEHNSRHAVVFVRAGAFGRVRHRERVLADANHVLFFNRGEPYRIFHPASGGDRCTSVWLPPGMVRELLADHAPRDADAAEPRFSVMDVVSSPELIRGHYDFLAAVASGAPRLCLEDALLALANLAMGEARTRAGRASVTRSPLRPGARRHRRDAVEEIKRRLAMDVERPPALGELARAIGWSPYHLSRSFAAETGVNLRRYVLRLRARAVANRLMEGPADLTRVALDFGYADHAHLTRSFREEWGVPPSRFRSRFYPGTIARRI